MPVTSRQPTPIQVLGHEGVSEEDLDEEGLAEEGLDEECVREEGLGEEGFSEGVSEEALGRKGLSGEEESMDLEGEEVVELEQVRSEGDDKMEVSEQFLPNHPFLVGLRDFLVSRHGKRRSDKKAKQLSVQVSKFLRFASPVLDPKHLYDAQLLDRYLKALEDEGKKASTQHGILCRIRQGLNYVNLSLNPDETVKAEKCSQLISNWLSTLGKGARRVKRNRLDDISDKAQPNLTEIEHFAQ